MTDHFEWPDPPAGYPDDDRVYTEECPEHGSQVVLDAQEGPPSMLGYGFDPGSVRLACGHTLTWSPLDGTPSVR